MLAILFILSTSLFVGYPLLAFLIKPDEKLRGDILELGILVHALGSFLIGWIAFILAEMGQFSIVTLILVITAIALPIGWLGFNRWKQDFFKPITWLQKPIITKPLSIPFLRPMLPYWSEYLVLLIWGIAAVYLFFRPHQFITGGADAGVYVNLSAHIANSGSILIDNPLVNQLDPAAYDSFLRTTTNYAGATHYWQPALYVTNESSRLIPQFYHLHPVWQAIGFAISGLAGALYLTGYWALSSSLVIYVLMRRWLRAKTYGRLLSLIGLAGLTLNAMQVWFARYPTTELLTQFLFWIGFFAFTVWSEKNYKEVVWGVVAGAAWGLTFLARIDTFFIFIIPAVLTLWLLLQQKWPKAIWGFLVPLVVFPAHSAVHGWWWSRPYFLEIFGLVGRTLAQQAFVLVILTGVGLGILIWLWWQRARVLQLFATYERVFKIIAMIIVVALASYSWFIRPYADPTTVGNWFAGGEIALYDHENLIRLGWYLSPLGVLCAVLGLCLCLWQLNKTHWATILMGVLFSIFYIYNIRNNPHQIYAMRRYVPVVLPFFVITAVWGFGWLATNYRYKYISLLLSVAWLAGIGWSARGFVTHIDYPGLPEQIATTAAEFEQPAVVLFSQAGTVSVGDFVGTPLYFLHDTHNFVWRDNGEISDSHLDEAIQSWQNSGYNVYWVPLGGDSPKWPLASDSLIHKSDLLFSTQILERTPEHKPTAVRNIKWEGTIYEVKPLVTAN